VAHHGTLTAGKNRRHRPATGMTRDVPDRVDARVHCDQQPLGDLAVDPARRAAEGEQLPSGDVTDLPIGELQDLPPEGVLSGHSP